MADQQLIDAWVVHLRAELDHQSRQLAIADQITRAVVERRHEDLTGLIETQQTAATPSRELRGRRQRVMQASAARGAGDGSPEAVCDGAEAAQREPLDRVRAELKEVVTRLQRVLDRNQLLLRTSLGLVTDTLTVVTGGQRGAGGYGRSGQGYGPPTGSGGLVTASA